MKKKIFGVGIKDTQEVCKTTIELGTIDGKRCRKNTWTCPYYSTWTRMLKRCYCPKFHKKQKSYEGVEVCEEWKHFSNFKSWMQTCNWEGKQLDKDLLGGGKLYSPETCCFLPKNINLFIRDGVAGVSGLIGAIKKDHYGYYCQVRDPFTKKKISSGIFVTPEESRRCWLEMKCYYAEKLSETIEDERVAKALRERYRY